MDFIHSLGLGTTIVIYLLGLTIPIWFYKQFVSQKINVYWMRVLARFFALSVSILVPFVWSGGKLDMLWQPYQLLGILGFTLVTLNMSGIDIFHGPKNENELHEFNRIGKLTVFFSTIVTLSLGIIHTGFQLDKALAISFVAPIFCSFIYFSMFSFTHNQIKHHHQERVERHSRKKAA